MKIKVLSSGSQGNCIILKSKSGSQLLLDVGVKYEQILLELDFSKPINAFVSHSHNDHSLSVDKLTRGGISVYNENNLEIGKVYDIDCWKIMPVPCYHNVPCLGAIIINKVEKLKILYIIDTNKIPNIADTNIDLALIECNYDFETTVNNVDNLKSKNFQYHLSAEQLEQWLSSRQSRIGALILCHLSNSSNIQVEGLTDRFKGLCGECYIATKGKEIII